MQIQIQIGWSFMYPKHLSSIQDSSRTAVILAGGEGNRLRPYTRAIAGDDRPKQFCKIVGNETLLQQTARRVSTLIHPGRTSLVLTRDHEPFFDSSTIDEETSVLVQPADRGTAAAILYSLIRIHAQNPQARVALFPADHYHASDAAMTRYTDLAFQAVTRQPELIILLGIVPTYPEVEYGWIQPGEPRKGTLDGMLFSVRRFWEKPKIRFARELLVCGCLWNSFICVSSVETLIRLIRYSSPELYASFAPLHQAVGTPSEDSVLQEAYAKSPAVDFSSHILSTRAEDLSVLAVDDASWTDMGSVDRVMSVLAARHARAS